MAGLCMMPALLFNPSTEGRILQFLWFWALSALAGKRNNPAVTILVMLGITAFNLLVPYGRVLFSLGGFNVTSGALLAGLRRGATLEGLFMLSRLTIRRDLRLPGGFGTLLGESFRIFSLMTEREGRGAPAALPDSAPAQAGRVSLRGRLEAVIGRIDGLMLELDPPEAAPEAGPAFGPASGRDTPPAGAEGRRHSPLPGIAILAAAVIAAWLPWVFFRA
jgi:heptaprenyl diphosphate synthase